MKIRYKCTYYRDLGTQGQILPPPQYAKLCNMSVAHVHAYKTCAQSYSCDRDNEFFGCLNYAYHVVALCSHYVNTPLWGDRIRHWCVYPSL